MVILIMSVLVLCMALYLMKIYCKNPKAVVVWQDCVPDSESAVDIAQVVYKVYFGEDFDDDDFYCYGSDTNWQVELKTYDRQEDSLICSLGGILINKKNGTVERAYITTEADDFHKYRKSKEMAERNGSGQ